MKYVHNETGEVWTGQPSTSRTSNFYLLTHEDKVLLGWELIEDIAPTEVSIETLKKQKRELVRFSATNKINSVYPQFKRENAALGVYGNEYRQQLCDFINTVREKVDEYDVKIEQIKTKDELDFEVIY